MPEETPQRKNQKKAPKTRPADDMLDGEDIRQWENPLAQVISDIHASLYETYDEYNRQAMVKQHRHVWFSRTAVFFGTLAILLSILQVFLRAYPDYLVNNPDLAIFEKGAFFTAIIAIGIAMGSRLLRDWLKQRYLAEQCRSLKFRALIHPYLSFSSEGDWNERFAKWKKRFDLKVADLKKKEDWSLEKILVVDAINAPPHESSGRSLNVPYLLMLTDYYQKKRISTQVAYFSAQARTFRNKNKITEWIPQVLFSRRCSLCSTAVHYRIFLPRRANGSKGNNPPVNPCPSQHRCRLQNPAILGRGSAELLAVQCKMQGTETV